MREDPELAVVSPNPNIYVFELHKYFVILYGMYLPEIGLVTEYETFRKVSLNYWHILQPTKTSLMHIYNKQEWCRSMCCPNKSNALGTCACTGGHSYLITAVFHADNYGQCRILFDFPKDFKDSRRLPRERYDRMLVFKGKTYLWCTWLSRPYTDFLMQRSVQLNILHNYILPSPSHCHYTFVLRCCKNFNYFNNLENNINYVDK